MVEDSGSSRATKKKIELPPSPSRWFTKEFYFYYFLYIVFAPYILKVAYDFSSESHPNYKLYSDKLSDGWLFGRKVDNSDSQFSAIRDNYQYIGLSMMLYLVLSQVLGRIYDQRSVKPYDRVTPRIFFILGFALLFLAFVYGLNALKILSIISVNYWIAKSFKKSRLNPVLTWVFNMAILFANEKYSGYRYSMISNKLAFMDEYSGLVQHWYVLFNISMLRMVSFNMDYYWSLSDSSRASLLPSTAVEPTNEKERVNTPCSPSDYNYIYYLAYILYTPLFLAGPIITFNNFISQVLRFPSKALSIRNTIIYGLRVLASILLMEILLHCFYVVSISKAKAWSGFSPLEMGMVGYLNLKLIWLKLFIIWRLFRFWAMADGIETQENMLRCMSNNYSALGFWRSWHRSYNRWLIRYIYVPLGGTKYQIYNIGIVFTFVALWHDISMNLLAWAWLITLFILPEIVCTALFAKPKFQVKPWYRHFAAAGAVGNILLMMTANLVGFAVGLEGVQEMITRIFGIDGILFLSTTFLCIFATVQMMFEIREHERRKHGHYLNY
ncbi:MBOAT-domain-containing protein [Basidiobolus meristosporus CBS 931.73]|uniref:MBOAT-domain-containing protein n=1 Tax=Basidiobolus meristosporus CBS 931.73 TaxID=1314790 RepID=A0A1Y1YI64_9FUNG|nr:MBOAT-domain-containing protein [Basidiobolus meristosporus CBS 931.73]|eukprot:ORX97731.1 MBOAT-domain-containing protein [Basidiobolus meristosporus CBS 931.73]